MLKRLSTYATLQNIILLAAALLTLSWIWGTMQALQRNFVLQQEVISKQQEVELLDLETQTLAFKQQYLKSDEFLELFAREHLDKAKPDENLLRLPNHGVKEAAPAQKTSATAVPTSNFQQWMMFFFGEKNR